MGCHVVAMPYPGRGHINPMINLCNLLVSRKDNILISFVVTEEWLGFLSSETKPAQIRYATIPNVIPSEMGRGADFAGFVEATRTKLEDPFERLLDRLEPPRPSIIIYDISLPWVVGVGERWNIPVAALWTLPASVFSVYHHFELLLQNGHFPANVSDNSEGSDSDTDINTNTNTDDSPQYYQPISDVSDPANSDGDSDDDSVFPHLANGYANSVEIGISSIDLSDDEDTKSNEEDDDERMREVTDSAIQRAFREDESRRNAPLTAETATRVMEAMRGVSFGGFAPDWANQVPEDQWINQIRRLRPPETTIHQN